MSFARTKIRWHLSRKDSIMPADIQPSSVRQLQRLHQGAGTRRTLAALRQGRMYDLAAYARCRWPRPRRFHQTRNLRVTQGRPVSTVSHPEYTMYSCSHQRRLEKSGAFFFPFRVDNRLRVLRKQNHTSRFFGSHFMGGA